MAFKQPWNRDTRMRIFRENFVKRQEMLAAYKYKGGPKPVLTTAAILIRTTSIPGQLLLSCLHIRTMSTSAAATASAAEGRWNEAYAKTHFVTAVVICFSGKAKTTRGDRL